MGRFHRFSSGVVIEGAFTYPHRPAQGRTVAIPVTMHGVGSGHDRAVLDDDRFVPPGHGADVGPFGAGGPGYVTLPEQVLLSGRMEHSSYVHFLADGSSRDLLQIDWPVAWPGRLLVAVADTWLRGWIGQAVLDLAADQGLQLLSG